VKQFYLILTIISWYYINITSKTKGRFTMIKAYGYLRVSSQGQVEKYGFDRQETTIKDYAKKAGIEIKGLFREEGVSGTKSETDRPAFQNMMTEILSNGVRTVIVEGLDRLAREYRIQETFLIYLASKGVTLISARTEEDVTQAIQDDPMKKALIQIQAVFSELEKNQLVRRLKKGRERAKELKGKCEGRPGFGESEVEQEVIKRIKNMRRTRKGGIKGMTLQAIADRLNSERIPTKDGALWSRVQVHRALNRKA
jgi:site-specific DNA recombinase